MKEQGRKSNLPVRTARKRPLLLNITPIQALERMLPKAKNSQEARDIFAGLLSGIGNPFGLSVPKWAINASALCWKSFGLDPSRPAELLGKGIGLLKKFNTEKELSTQLKFEAAQESPAVAAEFFDGQLKAEKVVELSGQLSVRAKMFCCIAAGWREVEKFKSSDELHTWLYSQKTASGQKYIPQPSQDPSKDPIDSQKREVRKVCQLIGLQFRH